MDLNQQQMVVVTSTKQNVVVDACPGSGKTTTLASKIKHLIEDEKVDPQSICVLSHTNVAAEAITSKLESIFSKEVVSKIVVQTIHAAAMLILNIDSQKLYTMADQKLILAVLKRSMTDIEYSGSLQLHKLYTTMLPLLNAPLSNDASFNASLIHAYSGETSEILRVCEQFLIIMDKFKLLTFHTSIWKAREMIESLINRRTDQQDTHHPILGCRYLIIDELQDISKQQCRFIERLIEYAQPICTLLGDSDQAIFGFNDRSSQMSINNLNEDSDNYLHYLAHKLSNVTLVTLYTNYRSTNAICAVCNVVNNRNVDRLSKPEMLSTRAGNKVQLYKAESMQNQLDFICESIKHHQNLDRGHTIAILLRTATMYAAVSSRLKFHGIQHSSYFGGGKSSTKGHSDMLLLECKELQHILPPLIDYSVATDTEAFRLFVRDVQSAIMNSGYRPTVEDLIRKLDADYSPPTLPTANHDERRTQIVNLLLNQAKDYDASTQLIQFLVDNKDTELICEEEEEHQPTNSHSDANVVYVGSVHSAKGLEFDVVYVPNVQQQCYPLATIGDYNEDCRVLFVAISRAKDFLYLTHVRTQSISPYLVGIERHAETALTLVQSSSNTTTDLCHDKTINLAAADADHLVVLRVTYDKYVRMLYMSPQLSVSIGRNFTNTIPLPGVMFLSRYTHASIKLQGGQLIIMVHKDGFIGDGMLEQVPGTQLIIALNESMQFVGPNKQIDQLLLGIDNLQESVRVNWVTGISVTEVHEKFTIIDRRNASITQNNNNSNTGRGKTGTLKRKQFVNNNSSSSNIVRKNPRLSTDSYATSSPSPMSLEVDSGTSSPTFLFPSDGNNSSSITNIIRENATFATDSSATSSPSPVCPEDDSGTSSPTFPTTTTDDGIMSQSINFDFNLEFADIMLSDQVQQQQSNDNEETGITQPFDLVTRQRTKIGQATQVPQKKTSSSAATETVFDYDVATAMDGGRPIQNLTDLNVYGLVEFDNATAYNMLISGNLPPGYTASASDLSLLDVVEQYGLTWMVNLNYINAAEHMINGLNRANHTSIKCTPFGYCEKSDGKLSSMYSLTNHIHTYGPHKTVINSGGMETVNMVPLLWLEARMCYFALFIHCTCGSFVELRSNNHQKCERFEHVLRNIGLDSIELNMPISSDNEAHYLSANRFFAKYDLRQYENYFLKIIDKNPKHKALFANALLFPKSDIDLNSHLLWTRLYLMVSYDLSYAYSGKAKNLSKRMKSHSYDVSVDVQMMVRGGSYDVTVLAFLPVDTPACDVAIMEDLMNCFLRCYMLKFRRDTKVLNQRYFSSIT